MKRKESFVGEVDGKNDDGWFFVPYLVTWGMILMISLGAAVLSDVLGRDAYKVFIEVFSFGAILMIFMGVRMLLYSRRNDDEEGR